jgi:hypothetical protein
MDLGELPPDTAGRVLAVGADRFALDAATCARIQVDAVPA